MLPQSVAPWHTEYCELKKFEKKEEGLSVLPLPFSPEIGPRPSCDRCPVYTPRRGASSSPSWRDTEDQNKQALLSVFEFTTLSSHSLPYPISS